MDRDQRRDDRRKRDEPRDHRPRYGEFAYVEGNILPLVLIILQTEIDRALHRKETAATTAEEIDRRRGAQEERQKIAPTEIAITIEVESANLQAHRLPLANPATDHRQGNR